MIGNMYIWPSNLSFLKVALTSLAVSFITGILGGLYPAFYISKLDPYENIRRGE
jgi:ABC-type antimicrobial peptide transport system permease subunit